MSQFAREHPEDYEDRLEAMVDAGDQLRKERKENPEHGRKTTRASDDHLCPYCRNGNADYECIVCGSKGMR